MGSVPALRFAVLRPSPRHRFSEKEKRKIKMDFFFNPKSVAIVGASTNFMKFGSIILANLFKLEYRGKIFPVNSKGEDIAGLKTYTSVREIPEDVELAILAIPAQATIEVMKDCAAKGIKGVVIISSGFKEAGETGLRASESSAQTPQVS
jgi:acyl-CoA synthetase (NDP forming)